MKEKLAAMWTTIKDHKAKVIKVAAVLVGAGIGVLVGAMFSPEEEFFDPDDITPDMVEEIQEIDEAEEVEELDEE